MNIWNFGLVMTTVGMGGTLVSLWLLTLVMQAIKKLFPVAEDDAGQGRAG